MWENLSFENVSFKTPHGSHKAIDQISFRVKTGWTIAFVGPSGSGKSTLMKLLADYTDLGMENII